MAVWHGINVAREEEERRRAPPVWAAGVKNVQQHRQLGQSLPWRACGSYAMSTLIARRIARPGIGGGHSIIVSMVGGSKMRPVAW